MANPSAEDCRNALDQLNDVLRDAGFCFNYPPLPVLRKYFACTCGTCKWFTYPMDGRMPRAFCDYRRCPVSEESLHPECHEVKDGD